MSSLGIENDTGGVLFFSVLEGDVSLLQILNHHQQPSSHTLTWLHKLRDGFCSICSTEKKDLENILLPTLTTEFFSLNAEHCFQIKVCIYAHVSLTWTNIRVDPYFLIAHLIIVRHLQILFPAVIILIYYPLELHQAKHDSSAAVHSCFNTDI